MKNRPRRIKNGTASSRLSGPCPGQPRWLLSSRRFCYEPGFSWPPDPLTRLLMEADGVTEAALNGLLQRIAVARAEHVCSIFHKNGRYE
jgi:hypothetical protein